jgi:hypothetical protein
MLPNTKIIIKANGDSVIEGLEKTEQCHKLTEMGQAAGKVTSSKPKDHTPVYHTVSQKG